MFPLSLSKKMLPIFKDAGVSKAAIFGSFARGDSHKKSDIDVLIQFQGQKTLFDLARLQLKLEKKMGKKIDVVTYDSLHPYLRKKILEEQQVIYEKRSKNLSHTHSG